MGIWVILKGALLNKAPEGDANLENFIVPFWRPESNPL